MTKNPQLVLCHGNILHQLCVCQPDTCQSVRLTDRCQQVEGFGFYVEPTCFTLSSSGEEAHHRPVRRPEGWTQPDLSAGGPLRSHPGRTLPPLSPLQVFNLWVQSKVFSVGVKVGHRDLRGPVGPDESESLMQTDRRAAAGLTGPDCWLSVSSSTDPTWQEVTVYVGDLIISEVNKHQVKKIKETSQIYCFFNLFLFYVEAFN